MPANKSILKHDVEFPDVCKEKVGHHNCPWFRKCFNRVARLSLGLASLTFSGSRMNEFTLSQINCSCGCGDNCMGSLNACVNGDISA